MNNFKEIAMKSFDVFRLEWMRFFSSFYLLAFPLSLNLHFGMQVASFEFLEFKNKNGWSSIQFPFKWNYNEIGIKNTQLYSSTNFYGGGMMYHEI